MKTPCADSSMEQRQQKYQQVQVQRARAARVQQATLENLRVRFDLPTPRTLGMLLADVRSINAGGAELLDAARQVVVPLSGGQPPYTDEQLLTVYKGELVATLWGTLTRECSDPREARVYANLLSLQQIMSYIKHATVVPVSVR